MFIIILHISLYSFVSCLFLQKPTVFMFRESEGLSTARGYGADVTRLIQRRLNFTDTLVPNTGFGAFSNGSWSGMVGDLSQGVSIGSRKLTNCPLESIGYILLSLFQNVISNYIFFSCVLNGQIDLL